MAIERKSIFQAINNYYRNNHLNNNVKTLSFIIMFFCRDQGNKWCILSHVFLAKEV